MYVRNKSLKISAISMWEIPRAFRIYNEELFILFQDSNSTSVSFIQCFELTLWEFFVLDQYYQNLEIPMKFLEFD